MPVTDNAAYQMARRRYVNTPELWGDLDLVMRLVNEMTDLDTQWDEAFANSPDLLERLADEALADFREGGTEPLSCCEIKYD